MGNLWRMLFRVAWAQLRNGRAVVAGSLLGGAVSLLGLAGGRWWGFDLCNNFQAQYFGFQVLCLLVLLGMRRFRCALLPVIFLLLPVWHLVPYYVPRDDGPAGLKRPLRVLSFNVLFTNTRYADTVSWVQATDPDIAFFPEVTPSWEAGLAPLKARMPHCLMQAEAHNFGFAVFSKYPIVEQSLVPSGVLGVAMVQLTLEVDGRRLLFIGMHPPSPITATFSHGRDVALADLAKRLRWETRPVVVAGDFNATPWSHAMRPLVKAGLRDTMWGRGFSATWQRNIPPLAIPIDQILLAGPIRVSARQTGPDLGSDHRPVVAELRWGEPPTSRRKLLERVRISRPPAAKGVNNIMSGNIKWGARANEIANCQGGWSGLGSVPRPDRYPPVLRDEPLKNAVGFLDAIKRWQLARQGLSSGRKRRVYSENAAIQALEESFMVKLALYATFAAASVVLVLNANEGGSAEDSMQRALYGFAFALTAVVMLHANRQHSCRRNSRVILVLGGALMHLLLIGLILRLAHSDDVPEVFHYLLVPFALAPMLHGILLGRAVGTFSAIYVSLIGSLMVPPADLPGFLTLSLVSGITAVLLTGNVRKRGQVLRAGILTGVVSLLFAIAWGRLDVWSCFGSGAVNHLEKFGLGSAAALGTAVFAALFISGLLPVFEGLFQLTTDISWLELGDLNHKLLRQMQLEAPGTFHHSLIVASLAEAAAEKIGANALMCRVCAYFHDVGKLKKPAYFIENQQDGTENPHDTLTPTMSALIIIAHVKDGVDLAVKNKLNPRIINVIQEHHGDSLVRFFYRRAQEQKKSDLEKVDRGLENPEDLPHVDEKNFRYPGQLPSTRESGIIALADMAESASRSLRKPTLSKIRAMIEDLVRAKLDDGQLDDCPLTLRELAVVKDSFAATLRSMLHARIDYPKEDDRPTPVPKRSDVLRVAVEAEPSSKVSHPPRTASPA